MRCPALLVPTIPPQDFFEEQQGLGITSSFFSWKGVEQGCPTIYELGRGGQLVDFELDLVFSTG